MTPADPSQLAGTPYRLGRKLGEGASGAVYEAEHVELGRKLAVKILGPEHAASPGALERFRHEARTVAKLSHRNIVQLYDFGKSLDGRAFLTMELCVGQTLDARLQSGRHAVARGRAHRDRGGEGARGGARGGPRAPRPQAAEPDADRRRRGAGGQAARLRARHRAHRHRAAARDRPGALAARLRDLRDARVHGARAGRRRSRRRPRRPLRARLRALRDAHRGGRVRGLFERRRHGQAAPRDSPAPPRARADAAHSARGRGGGPARDGEAPGRSLRHGGRHARRARGGRRRARAATRAGATAREHAADGHDDRGGRDRLRPGGRASTRLRSRPLRPR